MPKVVAIYARFSSDKQSDASIEDQVHRARKLAEREGAQHVEVFTDYALSGASMDRPGIQALIARVQRGGLETLYTESVDRLSRDVGDGARLRQLFAHHEVSLVCLDGTRVMVGDKSASMLYTMRAMMGEQYLADLADKTLRGLEGRARAGMATGGAAYGYRNVRTPHGSVIEIYEEQARVVRRIFSDYANGESTAKIAGALNAEGVASPRAHSTRSGRGWMDTAIRAMLLNPKYVGTWTFGLREWRKTPGKDQWLPRERRTGALHSAERPELAIVTPALWHTVQARFTKRPHAPAKRSYYLSGLLFCGVCGDRLIATRSKDRVYFNCSGARKRGTCGNRKNARLDDIERELIRKCVSTLDDAMPEIVGLYQEELERWKREQPDRVASTKREIHAVGARIARTLDLLIDTPSQALRDKLRELEASKAELERSLYSLDQGEPYVPALEDVIQRVRAMRKLNELSPEVAREWMRGLTPEGIHVTPGDDGGFALSWSLNPGPLLVAGPGDSGSCPRLVAGAGFGGWTTLSCEAGIPPRAA